MNRKLQKKDHIKLVSKNQAEGKEDSQIENPPSESQIKIFQEEMKIVIELVKNNTQTIMQLRYFLVFILTALIGYYIKEGSKLSLEEQMKFYIFSLSIVFLISIIEGIIVFWQNSHINRLWALDRIINENVLDGIKEEYSKIMNIDVFKYKDIEVSDRNYDRISQFIHAFISPSYFLFYLLIIFIVSFIFFLVCRIKELLFISSLILAIFLVYITNLFVPKKYRLLKELF